MEKIGIRTGGGDCPELNAVIRAVVRRSHSFGYDGGRRAADGISRKQFGYMASLRGTDIVAVPIEEALSQKLLEPKVFDDGSVFFG